MANSFHFAEKRSLSTILVTSKSDKREKTFVAKMYPPWNVPISRTNRERCSTLFCTLAAAKMARLTRANTIAKLAHQWGVNFHTFRCHCAAQCATLIRVEQLAFLVVFLVAFCCTPRDYSKRGGCWVIRKLVTVNQSLPDLLYISNVIAFLSPCKSATIRLTFSLAPRNHGVTIIEFITKRNITDFHRRDGELFVEMQILSF